MPKRLQRSTSLLSLLVYSAIGLLGYGLHLLAPCCDHHAAAPSSASCCGCGRHDCNASSVKQAEAGMAIVGNGDPDCDSCPICAVLVKAKASSFTLVRLCLTVDAMGDASPRLSTLYSSVEYGDAAARGPPSLSS